MDQYSYQETKDDVISIMNETIEHGNSIGGGLGRAEVEYWLRPLELNESKPTPYALKLLAAVSIGSLRHQNNLELEELYSVVEWLVENIDASDVSLIDPGSVNQLIIETSESFGETLASKIKLVVSPNT
ncbi:hypothetical protein L4D06_16115 [Enterovibrio makurazakiensis]|uniref:hypothetical protein n=1 Tax=Enterovibrio makurazakiensis TaxID=2910232 RepID=UPI003D1A83DF